MVYQIGSILLEWETIIKGLSLWISIAQVLALRAKFQRHGVLEKLLSYLRPSKPIDRALETVTWSILTSILSLAVVRIWVSRNKIGPRMLPWGMPLLSRHEVLNTLFHKTCWEQPDMYDWNHFNWTPLTPALSSLLSKVEWESVSKANEGSKAIRPTISPRAFASTQYLTGTALEFKF